MSWSSDQDEGHRINLMSCMCTLQRQLSEKLVRNFSVIVQENSSE